MIKIKRSPTSSVISSLSISMSQKYSSLAGLYQVPLSALIIGYIFIGSFLRILSSTVVFLIDRALKAVVLLLLLLLLLLSVFIVKLSKVFISVMLYLILTDLSRLLLGNFSSFELSGFGACNMN